MFNVKDFNNTLKFMIIVSDCNFSRYACKNTFKSINFTLQATNVSFFRDLKELQEIKKLDHYIIKQ